MKKMKWAERSARFTVHNESNIESGSAHRKHRRKVSLRVYLNNKEPQPRDADTRAKVLIVGGKTYDFCFVLQALAWLCLNANGSGSQTLFCMRFEDVFMKKMPSCFDNEFKEWKKKRKSNVYLHVGCSIGGESSRWIFNSNYVFRFLCAPFFMVAVLCNLRVAIVNCYDANFGYSERMNGGIETKLRINNRRTKSALNINNTSMYTYKKI